MANTGDFRNGLCLEFNNDLFIIVQFQHVKPGKGPAFVRTKMKSLTTGKVIENTFTAGVKVNTARVERRPYQYLYKDDISDLLLKMEGDKDSSIIISNYVQSWIQQELLLEKAELNLKEEQKDFQSRIGILMMGIW